MPNKAGSSSNIITISNKKAETNDTNQIFKSTTSSKNSSSGKEDKWNEIRSKANLKGFSETILDEKNQSFKKESRRQSDQSAEEKWAAIRAKKSLDTRSKKILGSE